LNNIPVRLAANSIIKAVLKGNDRSDNNMGAEVAKLLFQENFNNKELRLYSSDKLI